MENNFQLTSFADLNILQQIQESFSTATGLASVFADTRGVHLGSGSSFSKFCNKIRSHQEGCDSCTMSNYIAANIAKKNRKPFIYKCHAGLVDMVVPIIVNSQFVGMMLAGQIKCNDEEFPEIKKMPAKFKWQEDPQFQKMYAEIEILPRKKIEAAAQLLFVMVNYIVEKNIAAMAQQKLNEQNERLLQEIKARHELEQSLKEAELKALQHQINPHFMFNVLNSLNRLICLNELNKAQDVLNAFTKMLRYNMSDIDNIVTLQKELDYIEKYLFLQNLRFGSRISYEIKIDPELLTLEIPCFTLQPLVENAVVHGLEPKESGGKIIIKGEADTEKYRIMIKDNGLGISPDKIEAIKKQQSAHLKIDSCSNLGIGIKNVHKRLMLFFGDNYRFDIASEINQGTTIILTFSRR